jgi:hypothetical protein
MRTQFGFAILASVCGLLTIVCVSEHSRENHPLPLVSTAAPVQAPHLFAPCPVMKEVFPIPQERKA